VNSSLDAMQMGNEIPRGGILIAKLFGIACEAIGRHAIWKRVERLTPQEARSAVRRLERLDATRLPFAATVQEEKWYWMASTEESLQGTRLQDLLREIGVGGPRTWEITRQQIMLLLGGKGSILREGAAHFDALSEYARHPYAEKRPPPEPLSAYISRTSARITDGIVQSRFKDEDMRMQNALLTVALGLRAYRVEHGSYPSSLDALIAGGYLLRLPNDPFALSGPVHYRCVSADKYLLYSVGPDGVDDGGKPIQDKHPDGTVKPWMAPDSKGDFVLGVNNRY
jgi:hypothetical protein